MWHTAREKNDCDFFYKTYEFIYVLGNIDICKWNLEYANDGKRRYVPYNKS